jgi:5'-nucleotidase
MFQGTLESNIAEGADVVTAYNALGYTAVAIGNHEFDFGPVGPAVTISKPEQDARGALKARAAEAKFPFLVANILDEKTGKLVDWPNVTPAVKVVVAGVTVGIVGLSTQSTPYTTMPANFLGLKMASPADMAIEQARRLRAEGATVIIVAAHIGSACKDLTNPEDVSSCDRKDEVFDVIRAFPPGLVDAWVGGHTHAAVAHRINGVATIESFSSGRAFGRVDLQIDAQGKVTTAKIFPPQDLCPLGPGNQPATAEQCAPGPYEGAPVERDPELVRIIAAADERTRAQREEKLGVTATAAITRSYNQESALGNWFTDLMLEGAPQAQLALTNGGGLRANVPAGEITYGQLFEAMPFDNRFAILKIEGRQIREMVTTNLSRGGAMYSWGGLTAKAACKADKLAVELKLRGKPLDDAKVYTLVTSDFLATGGDGMLTAFKLPAPIEFTNDIMRDSFARSLRAKKGAAKKLDPLKLYDAKAPRIAYPGARPLRCAPNAPEEHTPTSGN